MKNCGLFFFDSLPHSAFTDLFTLQTFFFCQTVCVLNSDGLTDERSYPESCVMKYNTEERIRVAEETFGLGFMST